KILLDNKQTISGVITSNPEIIRWAVENNLTALQHDANLYDQLKDIEFDYLFSIANLKIITEEILTLPKKGAINFHDGLLPGYSGLNVPSWAIINDEKIHGITWHFMTRKIDAGDIISQVEFSIDDNE